jgi:LCP family protein required for cell wall assembly
VIVIIFSKIKWRYLKKFLIIAGSITGIYLVIATAVTLTLIAADQKVFNTIVSPEITVPTLPANPDTPLEATGEVTEPTEEDDGGLLKPPARTNFLLLGLDKENALTDVIMVGCFYRDSCEIRLMSIPRDMYTRIPEERLQRMRDDGRKPPSVMKINALRSYGGQANGIQYLTEQLGEMLGVQFDYFAETTIPAFRDIVDATGGVWMEVPDVGGHGGLFYDDPVQDLHINLPAGMTFINGDRAEQLLRFRSYGNGDLGRNAVQMEFMKQLFRQALTREGIMNDPIKLINTIIGQIRTNVGPDVIKYTPYITKLSGEKLRTYTMPGNGEYVNGVSYFFADESSLPETIHQVFYAPLETPEEPARGGEDPAEEGAPATENPLSKIRIQVLNGSRVAGLGSSVADELGYAGYNVTEIGVYEGGKRESTRIIERVEGMGDELIPFFKSAVTEQGDLPEEVDIQIILGQGEG